jgi:hypothetical protein
VFTWYCIAFCTLLDAFELWRSSRASDKSHMLSILRSLAALKQKSGLRQKASPKPFGPHTREGAALGCACSFSLATVDDGSQYFSQPESGLAAQSTYDAANPDQPAYYVLVARIAP